MKKREVDPTKTVNSKLIMGIAAIAALTVMTISGGATAGATIPAILAIAGGYYADRTRVKRSILSLFGGADENK